MNGRSAMCHAKRWAGILGLGAAVICVGWGCGEDPVEPEPVPTAITISPPSATLRSLDEAVQFRATVSDQNGNVMADVAVTWASSDGSVAAVDTEGLATAAGNGNAMVTASAGAASGSAEVTVAQEVVEVSVSPPADTLVALGDTVQLLAEARDANGHVVTHAEFAWSSGDVAVVTVDAAGLATAVANGSASVTASSGSVSGSAEVTVAQEVVEVSVSPPADTLVALGDTVRLAAEARDANGHVVATAEFAWSSGDVAVVTVDAAGLATAVANGSASVTASSGSVSGSAEVTVAQEVVEVSVSPPADTLVALGDTVRLAAEARDANGHVVATAEFAWSSGDEAVVTVDAAGLATAVANGSANVTASSGSAVGSAEVTVSQEVAGVSVSPSADTLVALGDTVRLAAQARDANGHVVAHAGFAWASADEAVVTVDAAGLATAVANGSASVTASSGSGVGSAEVTVSQEVAGVSVSPSVDTLVALGDTVRLVAEARDANGHVVADADFAWLSADEAVVTVDAAGLITAVANGSTSVTASSGSGVGSAAVTVVQEVAGVSVSRPADTLVALGDTVRVAAEALDANGHVVEGADFTWTSAAESVVTVDSTGLVTAVANGSAEVVAAFGEKVGSATVTVFQRAVEMRLWPLVDTILVADTVRLSAEASDANGHLVTNGELVWSSGDASVVTVTAGGLVRAIAAGVVEVTATESTSGHARTAQLWVLEPREELEELYAALDGLGWTNSDNWGTDAPLEEWYGVTTDEDGRITELDLSDNGLKGEIPAELALIESLEVLDLSGNGVAAGAAERRGVVLPDWMRGRAEHPFVPGVVSDVLPGPERGFAEIARGTPQPSGGASALPDSCSFRFPLTKPGDGLTGTIPPELGTLSRLRFLDLSDNSLVGEIPPELGNLENLVYLDLSANHLTGDIPPELGGLGRAATICLHYNSRYSPTESAHVGGLMGPIPPELGNLQNLRNLWLQSNPLTGAIPPELGNLRNLEQLHLADNQLTGPIPPELGNLQSLEQLVLAANQLTGPIPPELGNLQNLEGLILADIPLTGPIPPELGNLQNLRYMSLFGNHQLTGPIPPELGNLQNLEELTLSSSPYGARTGGLTGTIPAELGNLQNLRVLWVNSNQLTGPIPPELGSLQRLELLELGANQLTGAIPPELGNLQNLLHMVLVGNQITGTIPPELGNLQNLSTLALGWDSPTFGIFGNGLTGPIPHELGNLEKLTSLLLSHTQLTGPIPRQLENLRALGRVKINDTQLTGAIPAGFVQFRLYRFHWQNTELCAPDTEAFQDWLESIGDHIGGGTCASSGSLDAGAEPSSGAGRPWRSRSWVTPTPPYREEVGTSSLRIGLGRTEQR